MHQFQITRLVLLEMGTYNDMMVRPYHTNVRPDTLNQLQEVTQEGRRINPISLSGVAGAILRPTTEAMGVVTIAEGWNNKRFAFMMEVAWPEFGGGRRLQYLTGYTDHAEISYQGTLDPNMRLYFNNSIHANEVTEMTPLGMMVRKKVVESSQLLQGEYTPSLYQMQNTTHTMRPQDVFDTLSASVLRADTPVYDTRQSFARGKLKKSLRSNLSAPNYLSRVLHSYQQTMASAESEVDQLDELMGRAASAVADPALSQDPVLQYLQQTTSLFEGTSISYQELCMMDPTLNDRAEVILARDPMVAAQQHQRGSTEHWQGTSNNTIFATILAHSVPGLMVDMMLTKVAFRASNQTIGNEFYVQILDAKGFAEGLDLGPFLETFKFRLVNEVLKDLTLNSMIDIQVTGFFDIIADSRISISVSGSPIVDYVMPSFADALIAPVITNNGQSLQAMAHDISTLGDNLNVSYAPQGAGFGHLPAPAPYGNHQPANHTAPIVSFPGVNYGNSGSV